MKNIIIFLSLLVIISCATSSFVIKGKGDIQLKKVEFSELKGWKNDNQSDALFSFIRSCKKFAKMPESRMIGGKLTRIFVRDFRDVCEIADVVKGMSSAQARNFFENWFSVFLISRKNSDEYGKFTGYYIPTLEGRIKKTKEFKYPIYKKPDYLTTNEPYLTRSQIENGALNKEKLEILYVNDKIDLFFMHIQGSGNVITKDGVVVRLSFAAKNNQPYSSIGSYMKENNIISQDATYHEIKSFLKANPEKADKILNINDSYIFFIVNKTEDVIGSSGVALTAERSIAIDKEIIPYGYPIWLDINKKSYKRLMISQDTGSAINGSVRGDIFFGSDEDSENKAANMNNKGKYYILLPKNVINYKKI